MKILKPDAKSGPSNDETTTMSPQQATDIGSYGVAIARALQSYDIDSENVFRSVGIANELDTADRLNRLPTALLTKLYRACVNATNDPYFGLTVARYINISTFHALGYALAASTTLMELCRRLERYSRIVSQTTKVSVSEVDGKIFLRLEFLVDICSETEDAAFGFLIRTMRMLYKPEFNPVRVEFRRPMPSAGAEPYQTLMRAPVSFSHSNGLMVFDKGDFEQTLIGACPELAQIHDNIVLCHLARLEKSDVVTNVTQKIIEFLPGGNCDIEKVADAVSMSVATLKSRLAQHDTNFHQLLDDTRKELACNYVMQQPRRSMFEIAFLLGFSDNANFSRAFKRWTGKSPTEFRAT